MGDGFLYEGVKMGGELMTPLVPVDGWSKASDLYSFVPIGVARREDGEVFRPKMVVIFLCICHHRGFKC